jgi:hypothetical protein
MPRYLVERTFPDGLGLLAAATGARNLTAVIGANAQLGVTWVHSYVTSDDRRSYCIVDGPSPEALRVAARTHGLPVDRITEIRVLDPYAPA